MQIKHPRLAVFLTLSALVAVLSGSIADAGTGSGSIGTSVSGFQRTAEILGSGEPDVPIPVPTKRVGRTPPGEWERWTDLIGFGWNRSPWAVWFASRWLVR